MKRVLESGFALGVGICIAALATVVHNYTIARFPIGLVVAIAGSAATSRFLGIRFGRRGVRFWFFLGWTALVLRGASFGNSDELLIMANGTGNAFLGLGFIVVLLSIWSRI